MRSNLFQEKYLSLNEKDLAAKRINESTIIYLFQSLMKIKMNYSSSQGVGLDPMKNINHLLEIWQKQGLMYYLAL